jgi:hypothetical protein
LAVVYDDNGISIDETSRVGLPTTHRLDSKPTDGTLSEMLMDTMLIQ